MPEICRFPNRSFKKIIHKNEAQKITQKDSHKFIVEFWTWSVLWREGFLCIFTLTFLPILKATVKIREKQRQASKPTRSEFFLMVRLLGSRIFGVIPSFACRALNPLNLIFDFFNTGGGGVLVSGA